jgi:hypothetical protein
MCSVDRAEKLLPRRGMITIFVSERGHDFEKQIIAAQVILVLLENSLIPSNNIVFTRTPRSIKLDPRKGRVVVIPFPRRRPH